MADPAQAIVLIGMPGAGKTTVGRALAQLMQWGFVDIDDVVSAAAGDVTSYIESNGIDAFRALEAAAIAEVTDALRSANAPDTVLAVGGGAVLDAANRDRLARTGTVVWLRASLSTLVGHIGDDTGRPLLAGDAEAALIRLSDERSGIYRDLASYAVDVDGLDPNQVAVEVVKAMAS